MAAYYEQVKTAREERRDPLITESGGVTSLALDSRIYLEVTVDNPMPSVDVETATFTIKKLNADNTVDAAFNESVNFPFNDRLFRVTFSNGVATKGIVFKNSGTRTIDSTNNFRIKTPLIVDVVE